MCTNTFEHLTFLIANDDPTQLFLTAAAVSKAKHQVLGLVNNGNELIKMFNDRLPDVVLSDIVMPKVNGIDACNEIKNISPKTICILATSFNKVSTYFKIAFFKLNGLLFNPITPHKINTCLNLIINHHRIYIDLTYRKDFRNIVKKVIPQLKQLSELSELSENSNSFDVVLHNNKRVKINERHIILVSAIYHCLNRKQIANKLNISELSVDTNIKRLKQSLSIDDRIRLIQLFQEWGYIR